MNGRWTLGILIICALLVININLLVADGNWTRKTDMPTVRSYFSTSTVNRKVFVIGGRKQLEMDEFGNVSLSTVEMYDSETDTWERRADMPTARSHVSTSVVDGKIYAIGGAEVAKIQQGPGIANEVKQLPTVEMYDPVTDTWTQKADMPTARSTSTCVVDGKIYAVGGATNRIDNKKPWRLKIVEVYDPSTDIWAKVQSMKHARDGLTTSVVDGKIYAIGGMGWPQIPNQAGPFLSVVEVFNIKTNQWHEKAEMLAPKALHTTTVVNGKIYVIGGFFQGNGLFMNSSMIEIYDPATDRWNRKSEIPISKSGHTAETIKADIYIFGGSNIQHKDPFVTVEVYDTGEAFLDVNPTGKLVKIWGAIKK